MNMIKSRNLFLVFFLLFPVSFLYSETFILKDLSKIEGEALLFQENQFTVQLNNGQVKMLSLGEIYVIYPGSEEEETLSKIEMLSIKNNWSSEKSILVLEDDKALKGEIKFYQKGEVYFESEGSGLKTYSLKKVKLVYFYSKEILEQKKKDYLSKIAEMEKESKKNLEELEKIKKRDFEIFMNQKSEKLKRKIVSYEKGEFTVQNVFSEKEKISLKDLKAVFPNEDNEEKLNKAEKYYNEHLIENDVSLIMDIKGNFEAGELTQVKEDQYFWKNSEGVEKVYLKQDIDYIIFYNYFKEEKKLKEIRLQEEKKIKETKKKVDEEIKEVKLNALTGSKSKKLPDVFWFSYQFGIVPYNIFNNKMISSNFTLLNTFGLNFQFENKILGLEFLFFSYQENYYGTYYYNREEKSRLETFYFTSMKYAYFFGEEENKGYLSSNIGGVSFMENETGLGVKLGIGYTVSFSHYIYLILEADCFFSLLEGGKTILMPFFLSIGLYW